MANANYQQIGGPFGLLAQKKPFQGNSMSARWETTAAGNPVYRVFSYSTEIASYIPKYDNTYISDGRWSTTTSRHQNLCRAWL